MESRLLGLILVDDGPKLYDSQRRAVKRLLKMTPGSYTGLAADLAKKV